MLRSPQLRFQREQHFLPSVHSVCRHEPRLGVLTFVVYFYFILAGLRLVIPVECFVILLQTDYTFCFCYSFALYGISCCLLSYAFVVILALLLPYLRYIHIIHILYKDL